MAESLFLRLLPYDDKAATLTEAVVAIREGRTLNPVVHTVDPTSFRQVPGSPFAYWVSDRIRRLFRELPAFESEDRKVRVGLQTSDDFRFIRCWWEVSPVRLLDGAKGPTWRDSIVKYQQWCKQRTFEGKQWVPIAKGGGYAPFFDDLLMIVNWERDGEEIKAWAGPLYGNSGWSRIIKSVDFYFRPGLTWPLRGVRLSTQSVPAGSCFSVAGKLATSDDPDELPVLLGLMNSKTFDFLVGLFAGKVGGVQYEVGLIGKVPIPKTTSTGMLRPLVNSASRVAASWATGDERCHQFIAPSLTTEPGNTICERLVAIHRRQDEQAERLQKFQSSLDELSYSLYGVTDSERNWLEQKIFVSSAAEVDDDESEAFDESSREVDESVNENQLIANLVSYVVGCVVGRWDTRFATGEKQAPELPDPFAPLPVCSPGMLTGDDGLPLQQAPLNYPLSIDWDGILVDDPGHPDDIIRRVREALEVIWKERAEAIEHEACEILDIKDLRDYFRKPGNGGFWMEHVRRYSKSRRKAPIYWLLQSSKKNFALWIYYHRLDKDILFKVLLNYVEPKLSLVLNQLSFVRNQVQQAKDQGQGTKDIRKLENDAERLESFVSELRDFEDKLRRAANLHLEPDLNDGVVLNIAPLYELVPWKEAKNYWEELLAGKYEWSSISKQLREKGLVQ